MKKTKYYAWMMAAALAMTGCSDEIDTGGENGGATIDGETGYIKVALNLPTTSGTSTRANDVFDDGISAEYDVNDIIIALFYGNSEDNATHKWANTITDFLPETVGTSTDNITSKLEIDVQKVVKPSTDETVYALAILNNSGIFSVDNNKLKIGGNEVSKISDLTFTSHDLTELTDGIKAISTIPTESGKKGNFLMLNAAIANNYSYSNGNKPSDFAVTTLVPLTVYDDENDAEAANPDNIYVERAVAKVSVTLTGTDSDSDNEYTLEEGDVYAGATVALEGWKLQNTNKKWYYLRKVNDENIDDWEDWADYFAGTTSETNRFVGGQAAGVPYRSYWAIDPNYNTKVGDIELENNFNILDETTASWNNFSSTSSTFAEYCLENTTTATNMYDTQLTSVLVKGKFTLADASADDDLFMINNTSAIYSEDAFLQNLKNVLLNKEHPLGDGESLSIKSTAKPGFITDADGLNALIEITGGTATELSKEQVTDILAYVGNDIKYYKGGVMYYYAALIEHFGNMTPAPADNGSYVEAKHLGRYGVVRNNWYEMTITGVSGPGDPVPVIPDDPADKQDSFIQCSINILSWAKRTQRVEL